MVCHCRQHSMEFYNNCMNAVLHIARFCTDSFAGKLPKKLQISGCTIVRWFKEDSSDTKLCPRLSDYCNECYKLQKLLDSIHQQQSLFKVFSWNGTALKCS